MDHRIPSGKQASAWRGPVSWDESLEQVAVQKDLTSFHFRLKVPNVGKASNIKTSEAVSAGGPCQEGQALPRFWERQQGAGQEYSSKEESGS